MSGGDSGGGGGSWDNGGDTVTRTGRETIEVRTDGSALGMPYHETREINTRTGETELKDSGHF